MKLNPMRSRFLSLFFIVLVLPLSNLFFPASASPTAFVQKLIVVPVEFQDLDHMKSEKELDEALVKAGDYWKEVSYGEIDLKIAVAHWHRLNRSSDYYGQNPEGKRANETRYKEMIIEAVSLSDDEINFEAYNMLAILFAGTGEDVSKNPNDLWPWAFWNWTRLTEADGVVIHGAVIIPENRNPSFDTLGVYVHEIGHNIQSHYGDRESLLDLYDAYGNKTFLGPWSVMAEGEWLGGGSRPSELEAWSRIRMGWLDPESVRPTEIGVTVRLHPLEQRNATRAIKIPVNESNYYLVESRLRIGYDSDIPQEGILITLVDIDRKSGEGIVRAVCHRPHLENLHDVLYQVQELFADTRSNIFIYVKSKRDNAYDIQISSRIALIHIDFPTEFDALSNIEGKIKVMDALGNPVKNAHVEAIIDNRTYGIVTCDEAGEGKLGVNFNLFETGQHTILLDLSDQIASTTSRETFYVRFPDWIYVAVLLLILLGIVVAHQMSRCLRQTNRSSFCPS